MLSHVAVDAPAAPPDALDCLRFIAAADRLFQPQSTPRHVLLEALDLQVRFTQRELAEALQFPEPEAEAHPSLRRVRVEQQQRVEVEGLRAWQVQGRFDWRLPDDAIRIDSPFALVLLPGEQGESWRLLRPPGLQQNNWRSYPLLGRDLVVDDGAWPG